MWNSSSGCCCVFRVSECPRTLCGAAERDGGPAEAWTDASGPEWDNEPRVNRGLQSQTVAEPGSGAIHALGLPYMRD